MATELYHNKLRDSALNAGHCGGAKSSVQSTYLTVRFGERASLSEKGQKSNGQRQKKGNTDTKSTPTASEGNL